MKNLFFVFFILFNAYFLGSCSGGKQGMMPEISEADSVNILYYDAPGNYRFFKYTKVYDIGLLKSLSEDVNGEIIPAMNECTTQGKIQFHKGTEEVYTVYFSRTGGCMTFSFIKTGEKYFTRMSEASKKILDDLQAASIEPTPAG